MKKEIIIGLSSLILAVSCGTKETPVTETAAPPVAQPAAEEHHHDSSDSIELNNGEKWKVVPEMMKYIKAMEEDVTKFKTANAIVLKDYHELGKKLQANIDLLTSNCTMEGKAHDELHKWLLPYIEMVDQLNKSADAKEAQAIFEKIVTSFATMNRYFV